MNDCICIRDLVCYGYSGVLTEERTLGQRFVIAVTLECDLRRAGESDQLEATIDYAGVIRTVRRIVAGQQFQLIEAMAEAIAMDLRQDTRVLAVEVEVCKPQPPIPEFTGTVAVRIQRQG